MKQIEAILEAGEYRHYGIRIEPDAEVGEVLGNSWHNAADCDWVEEDTELDGTCCSFLQHPDFYSLQSALSYASCYWPGPQRIVLLGSNAIGSTDVPEDGAHCLRSPRVLTAWEQSL